MAVSWSILRRSARASGLHRNDFKLQIPARCPRVQSNLLPGLGGTRRSVQASADRWELHRAQGEIPDSEPPLLFPIPGAGPPIREAAACSLLPIVPRGGQPAPAGNDGRLRSPKCVNCDWKSPCPRAFRSIRFGHSRHSGQTKNQQLEDSKWVKMAFRRIMRMSMGEPVGTVIH